MGNIYMNCATPGCSGRVEHPTAKYCEPCCFKAIGDEIEQHPIGNPIQNKKVMMWKIDSQYGTFTMRQVDQGWEVTCSTDPELIIKDENKYKAFETAYFKRAWASGAKNPILDMTNLIESLG